MSLFSVKLTLSGFAIVIKKKKNIRKMEKLNNDAFLFV